VSIRFVSIRFVSIRFESIRFVSIRFVSIRFVSIRFVKLPKTLNFARKIFLENLSFVVAKIWFSVITHIFLHSFSLFNVTVLQKMFT
jgi:hypothetical protein